MNSLATACVAPVNFVRHLGRITRKEIDFHRFKPTQALFFMTYRCTCRCQSCTMWKRECAIDREMGLDEWISCFENLNSVGLRDVELFGGDALIRADVLMPLIRYIHDRGVHTNITVNGALLDEENAQALVRSGLDDFNISIDAMGALHDRMRGIEGLFETARRGIAHVVEARGAARWPQISLNATISAANVDDAEPLVEFAEALGMDTVSFEPFGAISETSIQKSTVDGKTPRPYFVPTTDELLFTRQRAAELKQRLAELKKNRNGRRVHVTSENIDILSVDELTGSAFPNIPCYVCRYLISVDPYGNVLPCPYFDNFTLGNARSEKIEDMWRSDKHRQFVRQQREGGIAMCGHCSIGVQRNRTLRRALLGLYLRTTRQAR